MPPAASLPRHHSVPVMAVGFASPTCTGTDQLKTLVRTFWSVTFSGTVPGLIQWMRWSCVS